jgi:hypothetical protein
MMPRRLDALPEIRGVSILLQMPDEIVRKIWRYKQLPLWRPDD